MGAGRFTADRGLLMSGYDSKPADIFALERPGTWLLYKIEKIV